MSERIAVISTSYPQRPGDAAGHFVASEVARWLGDGHEVHVFAPGRGEAMRGGATLHWLRDGGAFGWPGASARLRERPTRLVGAARFCLHARRELSRWGPFTRVQAHFLVPGGWPIATWDLPSGRPFEIVGHGSDVRLFCRLPRALRAHIVQSWLARGARVRVTSRELADLLGAACPELSGALAIEASPLDLDGVPTRSSAREVLAIPPERRVALVVSRLIPEKRVELALGALTLLEALSIIVVGDGPLLGALRARFPGVRFVGRTSRSDALCFIAAADVVVSASAHEGAPSVVREARALGVPVVAVAAGDLALWADHDPGLVIVRS